MVKSRLRIKSSLTIETREGSFGGQRWIHLLDGIDTTQSISAAARLIGLSYKAAWDAVDTMNNLTEKPLVERSKGGVGGGRTTLTMYGKRLVATFRTVEAENQAFLDRLNARIGSLEEDMRAIGRLNMRTSARNQFSGTVKRILAGAVNDEVELELVGGQSLIAIVTCESVENLGLKPGVVAVALVKASSVVVGIPADSPIKLSARNQLSGTIKRLTEGAVNMEVVIGISGGNSVAAIITLAAAKELELKVGATATAIFKASSVILATTA